MARYYTAYQPDLGFYPNYSLEVGDITGDGRKELAALTTDGNLVKVLDLEGNLVLKRRLKNYGSWGTILPVFADVDGDGRQELVVPDGPAGNAEITAINAENQVVREVRLKAVGADDYGIAVPMLGTFRRDMDGERIGISVGLAGGRVVALDEHFETIWEFHDLRPQFGHETFNCDVTGDGLDDIVFITVDRINSFGPEIEGELVILRGTDGRLLFRKRVRDFVNDTHFDDVAIADFRGIGRNEILVEKGVLFNLAGDVIWDISAQLDHGQWIATAPNPHGPGLVAFISELWSDQGKSKLIGPNGHVLWELTPDRPTRLHPARFPGAAVLPTRAHVVDWFNDGHSEIVLGEQISLPSGHACYEDMSLSLKFFFFDLDGNLLNEMPFENACVEGYWYNGEVRSRIADMDNDGLPEWAFPRQDGKVMIIKKEP